MIRGLSVDNIKKISSIKGEDKRILDYRLESFDNFKKIDNPSFGVDIDLNFDDIIYYKEGEGGISSSWDNINKDVYCEYQDLGVIESEKKMDGMGVQHDSEMIYHNMLKEAEDKGVIFTSIEEGLKKYKDIALRYFGTIVSNKENKYAALNSAVFSGGSFIYVPKNVHLDRPLQSYFRISSQDMGQFERTLIIVDEGASLHYIEGCTAPVYSSSSLHAAVVEIYVGKGASCRYSTIQNWAPNIYNLVTKRALVEEDASMTWVDGNIGSFKTMKYPGSVLKGDNSSGTCITISTAKDHQHQDSGANMIHVGKNTRSRIISKSIAKGSGKANYRGKVKILEGATNASSYVKCDSLILDDYAESSAFPDNEVYNSTSILEHEAAVERISKEKLFYLETRGFTKEEAEELIIMGFIDTFRNELPLEYSVELTSLLKDYF